MKTQHSPLAFAESTSVAAGHCLPFTYMTIADVCAATGFSTAWIYGKIRAGEFPPGELISAQSRRWKSTDIAKWLIEQSKTAEKKSNELAAPLRAKASAATRKSVERAAAKRVLAAQ